jgi:hypothetical protein
MPAQKLTYNSDGSINWASRAAGDQQQQGQPWNGCSDNNNNNGYYGYSGKYEQEDMPYRSSPNPNYSGDQINRLNSYYDDQTREPYDRTYRSSPNPNHNGNKINSYYGTQEQQSQPDPKQYYNQDTDIQPGYYERGGYDNQYNRNNNGYQGYDYNNNQNSQDQPPAANATAFAGGIKLAGALPDDGYRRGEGTFYDLETHVGICGKQSKNSEYVVAVNSEQMGEGGRSNPHCGKNVEIIGPSGKTIEATIVDSCKTCKESGLDLSPAGM